MNSIPLPEIGFGTGTLQGKEAYNAVRTALDVGYRLIDTAPRYENEAEVGRAIADSGIAREEITLITKCGHDAEQQGSMQTLMSVGESLGRLSMQYIDLLLIHWPHTQTLHDETWLAMQRVQRIGKVRAIGVSNYNAHMRFSLFRWHGVDPFVNQIEYHPYVYREYRRKGIGIASDPLLEAKIIGHSTFAGGQGDNDPVVQEIAQAHNTTPRKVLTRWSMQHGVVPLVRSGNPEHIRDNFDVNFALTDKEMTGLNSLSGRRLFVRNTLSHK